MDGHLISKRGTQGEPREVTCTTHVGCKWKRELVGARADNDAIVLALVRMHLAEAGSPMRDIMGHPKRTRIA